MATWVSYPELVDILGKDAARTLCLLHGGVDVYVPQKASAEHKLARMIGMGPLRALVTAYAGEEITVPNGRKADPMKGRIITALEEGRSHAAIALELGVTERHVRAIAGQVKPGIRQLRLL